MAMEPAASGIAGSDAALTPEAPAASELTAATGGARWFANLAEPRAAVPILLGLGAALFLVNLGGYPLYTKGEPREAVTVINMVHGGGFLLPLRAGVEIPSKPPLMHWLAAAISILAGGVNEWTVRMPSALFAIGGLLACYMYMRRLFDARIALLSALILGTTVQYLQAGSGARVDMTLTFFMEIAFFEFILIAEGLTARRMTLYFAIAMAVLSKGPIGLVLPVLVATTWIAFQRRTDLLRELRLGRGALLITLLAGGWYLAATIEGGMPFVHKQILTENLFRFFGQSSFPEGHVHRFTYMEAALVAGFMPWSPLMLILVVQAARRPRTIDPRLAYLMTWFAAVLIFYNLAQSKRGVYLLALYPALASLLAIYLEDAARAPDAAARWIRYLTELTVVVAIVAGVGVLAGLGTLAFAPHRLERMLIPFGVTDYDFVPQLELAGAAHPFVAMALGAATIVVGLIAGRGQMSLERLAVAMTGAAACLTLVANLFVVPALANALSLKPFTRAAMRVVGQHSAGYMGALNYDVAFYSGRNLPVISVWGGPRPDYLIAWREAFIALPPALRAQFQPILLSHPTEVDGSGGMVLLRCEPASGPASPARPHGSEPPQFSV